MEKIFTHNYWLSKQTTNTNHFKTRTCEANRYFVIMIIVFLSVCTTAVKNLKAQTDTVYNQSAFGISITQMQNECLFFQGDSLMGFNLTDSLAKYINTYTSYIELQSAIFLLEAEYVKQRYDIAQLPFELAAINRSEILDNRANASCSNVDFEDGDFNGWVGGKGYNALSTNPLTIFNTGIFTLGTDAPRKSCSYHTLVTGASGNDFYGGFPVSCPNGGTYSVRLGGDNVNIYNGNDCNNLYSCTYPGPTNPQHAAGEVLEQTFTVSATNTLFTFYYAADLNDGGHAAGQQAYFAIQVYDSTGSPISCFSHRIELVAGQVPAGGFLSTNGNCKYSSNSNDFHVYSIPWQADSYNLSTYIGQTLTVKFTAAGCTLGGHFGIGYFDAKCGPAEISTSNSSPCSGQNVVLTAPPSASGMYVWTGPGIVGANNTQSITINSTGTYAVTVGTGACAYPLSIVVAYNPSIVLTTNSATICNGQSTTLNVSGADAYVWMPGGLTDSTVVVSPSATTVYTITGTTGICSTTINSTVIVNSTPSVLSTALPASICSGSSSTLTATGATTYSWLGLGSANPVSVSPMATTTYSVTGLTAFGCSATSAVTVVVNPLPTVSISATPSTSCFGSNNASAMATATSGTPPYIYNWSNGATTAAIVGLLAGNYSVTVTDYSGCTATSLVVITQPPLLTSAISASTHVSCFGGNNGSATVLASGGTTPYTYNWTNGANTATNNGLIAGNYSVTVTDYNGCTATATVVITQPPLLTSTISTAANVSCYGGNNGSATVLAGGGTLPYTYNWSNGATTTTITGLIAGTYSVTITDFKGCTASATVVITQPPLLTAAISASANVSCFGGNNGSATVLASGGTTPYNYNWSNGAATASAAGLIAGSYQVTVTDFKGCSATATVVISQPTLLTAAIPASTNVSCFGGNNGSAMHSANGGMIPYTFLWSNGATTLINSGLIAGNYTVTVTDYNGCTATSSVVITQPPLLTADITDSVNVSCFGWSNGSATVSASGGTLSYSYEWSNGSSEPTTIGLSAGTYTVTITDSNGCTATSSVVISQPPLLIASITISGNVSCFGGNNSSASVSASGGTPVYAYNWSNGATTTTISNLTAGNYSVTVTDYNGCTASSTVVITQPSFLSSSISIATNILCFGGNTGSATVTATGGTTPYAYVWSNGATAATLSGLIAGSYSVTVTDYNGCTATAMNTIVQPTLLTLNAAVVANVSCFGGNNATAIVSASGGVAPYGFNWSNGATAAINSGLSAGTYTVTVTDINGCTASSSVVITQPTLLTSSITASTNVLCFGGNNGSASVTPIGGTTPYAYSWSNGGNTATISPLVAGTYTVTITDYNGCTATASVVITQPIILMSSMAASTNVSCFGGNNGSASVATTGGTTPYAYNWSNGDSTSTISGLAAGSYSVTTTDNSGCTNTNSVIISQPTVLTTAISASTDVSCFAGNNGTATVLANGGTTPYTYNWSTGATTTTIGALAAGTYYVTTTDNSGCSASASVVINQPTLLTSAISFFTNATCLGGNNGSANILATGGTTPYTYNWSNGATTASTTGLTAGNYLVTVTDNNGCTASTSVIITQPPMLSVMASATANVACFGGSNGAAVVLATGGSLPYVYNWSNGGTTASITGLIAGNYTLTVTDSNGCFAIASVVITQPTLVAAAISASANVSCFGGNNGTATVIANGGTPAYTYNWWNGTTTATIGGLAAGTYSVTIADNNGCSTSVSVIITQPTLLTSAISASTNVLCFGGNNGTAAVVCAGGTPPYAYSWSTGATTQNINNLTVGSYTVSISDILGCSSTAIAIITQPTLLNTSIPAFANVSCFGGNNGTATALAVGGTLPYGYHWSNGATTATINGLLAGNYTVTVTDNNGCTASSLVIISQPPVLAALASTTANVACFGGNNGSATVVASGGTTPYTYQWSNGATTAAVAGLIAGNYTVTVTDFNGCSAISATVVTQPTLLTASIPLFTHVWCVGGNNGSAMVSGSGGTTPYTFLWSNGATTPNISGLTAGTYSVAVTDNHGCTASSTITLTATLASNPNFAAIPPICEGSAPPLLGNISPNGISGTWSPALINNTNSGSYTFTPNAGQCANSQTLAISITPLQTPQVIAIPPFCSGSTAPPLIMPPGMTGTWFPATIDNSSNGTYTFTPDADECAVPQTLSITIIPQTIPSFAPVAAFCSGALAPVLPTTSLNGVTGYWSPSVVNNTQSAIYTFYPNFWECATTQYLTITVTPQTIPNIASIPAFCEGTLAPQLANTSLNGITGTWLPAIINNTSSATYNFTPTAGICATHALLNVTVNPQPDIVATAAPAIVCTGNSTVLSATGGNTYHWMPGNLSGSSINCTPMAAMVYTVTSTSASGCTASTTLSISIAPTVPIYFSAYPFEGCVPLTTNFNFIPNSLVNNASLHWNFGDPLTTTDVSTQLSPSYTYTHQGNFVVSLNGFSVYGCPVAAYDTLVVWPKPVADFMTHPEVGQTDDPLIYFYDQSVGATYWSWNFGDDNSGNNNYSLLQNPSHNYTDSGSFVVELIVENNHGCSDTAVKTVKIIESFVIWVPSAFTPNGDGNNEGFRAQGVGIDESKFTLYVFDRWGKEMFKTHDFYEAWGGKNGNNDLECEQGVYVWLIDVTEKAGLQHTLKGTVTLIR